VRSARDPLSNSLQQAVLVTANYSGIHRAVVNHGHDRRMKHLLTKFANFFASLIATNHDERLYADL
jgi:hypothetical protein